MSDSEQLDSKVEEDGEKVVEGKERRNSLVAFLRAIRFRKSKPVQPAVERDFAQLHSRARPAQTPADEKACIRSAN